MHHVQRLNLTQPKALAGQAGRVWSAKDVQRCARANANKPVDSTSCGAGDVCCRFTVTTTRKHTAHAYLEPLHHDAALL